MEIIRNANACGFDGCDFVVRFSNERKHKAIKLLQLTDMQLIDATQRRTPDRLPPDQIMACQPEMIEQNVLTHIKSLVAQTRPDLIFITGDLIYGSFDDAGTSLELFCDFMDSLEIPWAPVFGNHDNESNKGVDWQCSILEKAKYCLFCRGNVSGNGNYTVGLAVDNELVRVMHMLDSHGCKGQCESGLYPDQLEMVRKNTEHICQNQGRNVPAFLCCHHPTLEFAEAAKAKGYVTDDDGFYQIGIDVEAKDGDFGSKQFPQLIHSINVPGFMEFAQACNIDGVFVGHIHSINTCITYKNIRWVFGLKTGQYDFHIPGQLGGTLVRLDNDQFEVSHVPALVNYAPFPRSSKTFKNFFVNDTENSK